MLKVRKASYNGIEFSVQSTDVAGGHRQSEHHFNNNKTRLQQHGIKNRTYTLSALHFGANAIKQANNLIDRLEKSGAGILMHPDYGELAVGFDTFSTGVNTKRNMVQTNLNFLQDDDVNLLSVDFESLLIETIKQTTEQVINSTVNAITTSNNKFETILGFKKHINNDITLDNMNVIITRSLESIPIVFTSSNPITQTFNQQHQALFVATNSKGKKYKSTSELTTDASSINQIFNNPLITNSDIANEFYHLKSVIARQLIDNNTNLPKIKTHIVNAQVPADKLKHLLGSEVDNLSTSIHPLFSDNEVKYVS